MYGAESAEPPKWPLFADVGFPLIINRVGWTAPVASKRPRCHIQTSPWARGRSRRSAHRSRPLGRRGAHPPRHGRPGNKPPARPTPNGFAICYRWGASEKVDLNAFWLTLFRLTPPTPLCYRFDPAGRRVELVDLSDGLRKEGFCLCGFKSSRDD